MAAPVNTFWDIGMDAENCIWFHQTDGVRHPLIDLYQNSGEGLPHCGASDTAWQSRHYRHHTARTNNTGTATAAYCYGRDTNHVARA